MPRKEAAANFSCPLVYHVNWKAKVYIMQKSGSGAKTKWTSVINGSSVKKNKAIHV